MSNPYFHFKQFSVVQNQCAQKISETACIQGAWTTVSAQAKNVLDIGSGTGLLGLMIAQRYEHLCIDTLELDEATFLQGKQNIEASRFSNRIRCLQGDIKLYVSEMPYDFIICNPPFFENQFVSGNGQLNVAKHSSQLTLEELLKSIDANLSQQGECSILFPYQRLSELTTSARRFQLFPKQQLTIKHTKQHEAKVVVVMFSRSENEICLHEDFFIQEEGQYSKQRNELLNAYYL
ncbi:MAG: methyltransferase [Bacteroidetes bacterium]|nr:methyltransferase [Bacteroidota bacterium]